MFRRIEAAASAQDTTQTRKLDAVVAAAGDEATQRTSLYELTIAVRAEVSLC